MRVPSSITSINALTRTKQLAAALGLTFNSQMTIHNLATAMLCFAMQAGQKHDLCGGSVMVEQDVLEWAILGTVNCEAENLSCCLEVEGREVSSIE